MRQAFSTGRRRHRAGEIRRRLRHVASAAALVATQPLPKNRLVQLRVVNVIHSGCSAISHLAPLPEAARHARGRVDRCDAVFGFAGRGLGTVPLDAALVGGGILLRRGWRHGPSNPRGRAAGAVHGQGVGPSGAAGAPIAKGAVKAAKGRRRCGPAAANPRLTHDGAVRNRVESRTLARRPGRHSPPARARKGRTRQARRHRTDNRSM